MENFEQERDKRFIEAALGFDISKEEREAQFKKTDFSKLCERDSGFTKDEVLNEVLNFGAWYSGMEREKVEKAYKRWQREENKSILKDEKPTE